METIQSRMMERIEALAAFNDTPGSGITRFSYGKRDAEARSYLFGECRRMGFPYSVDAVGNIRVRYEGTCPGLSPVLFGSHIDSVRNGGKYDGIVGVVTALEVLSVLSENGIRLKRPVELIIFAEEEGSNFGTTMLGSKALVGKCDCSYLKELTSAEHISAYDIMKGYGLHPENIPLCRLKPGDVYAMLELHVEQGIVLEQEHKTIGVVEAIAGMQTYRVKVNGKSNHAGATPMNMRQDPAVAAAKLICEIEEFARTRAYPTTVATVGEITCEPNAPNVIPQSVQFSVDIRDIREDGIEQVVAYLKNQIRCAEESYHVTAELNLVGTSGCIRLHPDIVDCIEACVKDSGISYMRMNSGAVHDAAMLTEVTRVGMIFVPSADGKSHTAEEYTEPADIKKGADLLLEVVRKLADGDLGGKCHEKTD